MWWTLFLWRAISRNIQDATWRNPLLHALLNNWFWNISDETTFLVLCWAFPLTEENLWKKKKCVSVSFETPVSVFWISSKMLSPDVCWIAWLFLFNQTLFALLLPRIFSCDFKKMDSFPSFPLPSKENCQKSFAAIDRNGKRNEEVLSDHLKS